jgi:hypothetical protein
MHRVRASSTAWPSVTSSTCARTRLRGATKYLDEALHADARHERVSPPCSDHRIRNDMLRAFLAPGPTDLVVDLGCGTRARELWNRDWQAHAVGIDLSPFFAHESRQEATLLGDLRRLTVCRRPPSRRPLARRPRTSLARGAARHAREAAVIAPGGRPVRLHARAEERRIASGSAGFNKLARQLERMGLIDCGRNGCAIRPPESPCRHSGAAARRGGAGFRIARIRYYTPIVGGFRREHI